jgi:hypothetical protein
MEIKISFALMKKILIAILLVTYTFAASGASVDLHYCMGKFIGWDFDYASKNGCSECGMQTKPDKGCCDNKQIQVKVDKDQQVVYKSISFGSVHFAIVLHSTIADDVLVNANTILHPSIHAPPLISNTAIYLLNCNFRI